jgi:HSP90 family molecular chaperone
LEINPDHPLVRSLFLAQGSATGGDVAALVTEQLMDNALMAAGLMDDPRGMIPRLNSILASAVKQ